MKLILIIMAAAIFLLNIPFGYWRTNVRKMSLQWYLAIHIPVLAVVLLRVFWDMGWSWVSFGLFVAAFFLGQLAGAKFYQYLKS